MPAPIHRSRVSPIEPFDPAVLAAIDGLDLKARYVMEGFLSGVHRSPFHGFSVEFSDYRNYQPGDDLRHLDWRLYARSDRLCTKRYMQETNVRFYVICDTSASMAYRGDRAWGSKLDVARILAAALTRFMLKQNDAAGMVTLADGGNIPEFIRPSQRPSQLGLMFRQLDALAPAGGERMAQLLDHAVRLMHRRSVVLIFSDFLEPSESLASDLKRLRYSGNECLLFQILDRDELEFPFTESRQFVDLESDVRRAVNPSAARERYLERFHAFMENYRQLFQMLEMPHCVVRTDESPWEALKMFLAQRERLR